MKSMTFSIRHYPKIQVWHTRVERASFRGYQTTVIRHALEYFIQNGEPCEVARVCLSDTAKSGAISQLGFFFTQSPLIVQWLDMLEENQIKRSDAVRAVLNASISTVSEPDDEWFISLDKEDSKKDFLAKVTELTAKKFNTRKGN